MHFALSFSVMKNDTYSMPFAPRYLAYAVLHIYAVIAFTAFCRTKICGEQKHIAFAGF